MIYHTELVGLLTKLNNVESYWRQQNCLSPVMKSTSNSLAVALKILSIKQKTHCLTAHHTHKNLSHH